MARQVSLSAMIHATPEGAHTYTPTGGNAGSLTIDLSGNSSVTLFTGNDALAVKLAGAINAAIAEHKAETEAHESFRLVEVAA